MVAGKHALVLMVISAAVCSGCPPPTPASAPAYEACGICFESSEPLSLVRGLKVDSCTFQFQGSALAIRGEHSAFVGEPDERIRVRLLPGGGARTRSTSPDSGKSVIGIWMPEAGASPPLDVSVEYENGESERIAEQIISTVHRCGAPPR